MVREREEKENKTEAEADIHKKRERERERDLGRVLQNIEQAIFAQHFGRQVAAVKHGPQRLECIRQHCHQVSDGLGGPRVCAREKESCSSSVKKIQIKIVRE